MDQQQEQITARQKKQKIVEPIRESVVTLVLRLAFVIVLADALFFSGLLVLFYAQFHSDLLLMLAVLGAKTILQVILATGMVLEWINDVVYLADTHLIQHHGVFNVKEKTYDLKIIRSITIQQDVVGKILDYGDIDIRTSASGGYNDDIYLSRVAHPHKCKEIFEELLEEQQQAKLVFPYSVR